MINLIYQSINQYISAQLDGDYRQEDTGYAYEGLISANLRAPEGSQYQTFVQAVIDEFQIEEKFAGVDHLTHNASIDQVSIYFLDHHGIIVY